MLVELDGSWDSMVLDGVELDSANRQGVRYELRHRIAQGGGAAAYIAVRRAGAESRSVVVKLMRPEWLNGSHRRAMLAYEKEVGALARLSDGAPGTRYVVRLIDTGRVTIRAQGVELEVPWLALEHVDGGPWGTTLRERVESSIAATGAAFSPWRAARALHCIAWGLHAVHELGMVHRDLSPSNVLCTGQGAQETFKIADFGLTRDPTASGTFGGAIVGTIGYVAPEQLQHEAKIGPPCDVFSAAAIVFYVLTGATYLHSNTLPGVMIAARSAERPKLLDARHLSRDLRRFPELCRACDAALARGTHADPRQRQQWIGELAREVLPLLYEIAERAV